jgi:DNA (cytosine-5)-methyltransferase 1
MRKYKTIDLFAGIGGIRLAFEKAGFNTVFANDFEEKCSLTYNINFNNSKLVVDDIKNIDIRKLPNFNFLLGGFPCQPFSIAGKKRGLKDKRGTLFFEIADILEKRKPVGFFLENVKNLAGKSFEKEFKKILNKLDDLGYDVKYSILNSMEYGNIPQNRERIYIVGFLKNTGIINKFEFPKPLKLKKTIYDILEKKLIKNIIITISHFLIN